MEEFKPIAEIQNRLSNSVMIRMMLIGVLIIVLQIPIALISDTVSEREATRSFAIEDVTRTWGGSQTIAGPILSVPYLYRSEDDKGKIREITSHACFLPDKLEIYGNVETQIRYRGIFEVPLYTVNLKIKGTYRQPNFAEWQVAAADILWDNALLTVGITYPKAICSSVTLQWGKNSANFGPGRGDVDVLPAGIHLPIPKLRDGQAGQPYEFSFDLALRGSSHILFAPFGSDTKVSLTSKWSDPSFCGGYLPSEREVTAQGFSAVWQVPYLGRNYPQQWKDGQINDSTLLDSNFGVSLLSPVDTYHMTKRAVKYQLLFLFLTFLTFYLFELFYQLKLHPVQYLMVGSALCLFYLLLLSLSEHLGFRPAYAIASAAVVLVIGGYCKAILKTGLQTVIVACMLMVLYTFLYFLLQVQDYALLVGSLGIFVILTVVMYITRKVDWYHLGSKG